MARHECKIEIPNQLTSPQSHGRNVQRLSTFCNSRSGPTSAQRSLPRFIRGNLHSDRYQNHDAIIYWLLTFLRSINDHREAQTLFVKNRYPRYPQSSRVPFHVRSRLALMKVAAVFKWSALNNVQNLHESEWFYWVKSNDLLFYHSTIYFLLMEICGRPSPMSFHRKIYWRYLSIWKATRLASSVMCYS